MQVIFIRHAESTSNIQRGHHGGHEPLVELTENGISQAIKLGQRFNREITRGVMGIPDQIHVSWALRAQTTEHLAVGQLGESIRAKIGELLVDGRLNERDKWEWVGQLKTNIPAEMYEASARSHGTFRPPRGESEVDTADRMERWIHTLEDKNHWAFSHGWSIKCLLARLWFFKPWTAENSHRTDNTWITELEYKNGQWALIRYNDHAHLWLS